MSQDVRLLDGLTGSVPLTCMESGTSEDLKIKSIVKRFPGIWQDAGVMLGGTPQHMALTLLKFKKN